MNFETNVPYIQKVYSTLKRAIVLNELKQGQVLNERDLSEELNISRTPLRDGLNLLENEGWIEKRGKSRIVSVLTWRDIEEIYELRVLNECYAVRKVVQNLTPEGSAHLLRMLERMRAEFQENRDRITFLEADQLWHQTLDEFCGNSRLDSILHGIYEQFVRISFITNKKNNLRIEEAIEEHAAIYQAILDKKPDEAAAASERHIAAWFHSLKENWEEKNE